MAARHSLKITLAAVARRSHGGVFDPALDLYLRRISAYAQTEATVHRTVEAFQESCARQRERIFPVLLDSRGKAFTSEQFATWLGARRDAGERHLLFAIGPADGWPEEARRQAGLLLSLGPMTLPHELARAVAAEQIYRAFTMLAGHPYHRE